MGKQRIKPNYHRRVLRLPDLDHCKLAVLNSLGSPASRRVYEIAIDQFVVQGSNASKLDPSQGNRSKSNPQQDISKKNPSQESNPQHKDQPQKQVV